MLREHGALNIPLRTICAYQMGMTEGVLLGKTFLQELELVLTEIQAALNGIGIPTPATFNFLDVVLPNSTAPDKGGAPLISTRTRTE